MHFALLLVSSAQAHVSLNTNYGAESGGYFQTSIKVPHGKSGMHTSKLVLEVPRGMLSIKPEVPAGWSVAMSTYEVTLHSNSPLPPLTLTLGFVLRRTAGSRRPLHVARQPRHHRPGQGHLDG